MDNAEVVRVFQRGTDLLDEARAAPQREVRLSIWRLERAALDQPHDEVDKLAAAPEIDHGQDVRMLQVGDDAPRA